MATQQVGYSEDVVLQDGREVTLRSSNIATLRKVMDAWQKFEKVETESEGFDIFVNCCGLALASQFSDEMTVSPTAEEKKKGEYLSKNYKEYLESVLDIDTIYRILDVCAGLKLNDPKLMEAVQEAALGAN